MPFTRPVFVTQAFGFLLALFVVPALCAAGARQQGTRPGDAPRVEVFLDCTMCDSDYLRTELGLVVDFVRERSAADVHVLITSAETAAAGREYTLAFIGQRAFAGQDRTLLAVTAPAEPEDVVRRQLATSLRVGLLQYVAANGVPADLHVTATLKARGPAAAAARDPWNSWVFNLRGSAAFEGEESSRQTEFGASLAANRITPDWKLTLAGEFEEDREEFDLDEDEPVSVRRRERDFDGLLVNGLGEHWSVGAVLALESSTFDNMALSVAAAPAVEFNLFPYSAYTRRQLRTLYAIGADWRRYYERTLFGRTRETVPLHSLSVTYEQRERWGSLQATTEWSQFLNQPDKTRLELEADISLRVARGLSAGLGLNASRIRDQIGLPVRGASAEEILLRLRRLQSGYEYDVRVNLTYSFGSVFSSIVNPRFGR